MRTRRRGLWVFGMMLLTAMLALAIACGDDDDDDDDDDAGGNGGGGAALSLSSYAESFCGEFDDFTTGLLSAVGQAEDQDEAIEELENLVDDLVSGLEDLNPPDELEDWHDEVVSAFDEIRDDPNADPQLPDPPAELATEFENVEACSDLAGGF